MFCTSTLFGTIARITLDYILGEQIIRRVVLKFFRSLLPIQFIKVTALECLHLESSILHESRSHLIQNLNLAITSIAFF